MSIYKEIRLPDGKEDRAKINNESHLRNMNTHDFLFLISPTAPTSYNWQPYVPLKMVKGKAKLFKEQNENNPASIQVCMRLNEWFAIIIGVFFALHDLDLIQCCSQLRSSSRKKELITAKSESVKTSLRNGDSAANEPQPAMGSGHFEPPDFRKTSFVYEMHHVNNESETSI
ncbi:unnamed protein product [Dovyalis caffra]|uniref:Uncharacterized protein n=1 Tax=Dovyalis caffra TaxID=77055 RepID=A0AAV1RMD1_9ROSI|nr:unnamed protein product [Dovyalis caffra]